MKVIDEKTLPTMHKGRIMCFNNILVHEFDSKLSFLMFSETKFTFEGFYELKDILIFDGFLKEDKLNLVLLTNTNKENVEISLNKIDEVQIESKSVVLNSDNDFNSITGESNLSEFQNISLNNDFKNETTFSFVSEEPNTSVMKRKTLENNFEKESIFPSVVSESIPSSKVESNTRIVEHTSFSESNSKILQNRLLEEDSEYSFTLTLAKSEPSPAKPQNRLLDEVKAKLLQKKLSIRDKGVLLEPNQKNDSLLKDTDQVSHQNLKINNFVENSKQNVTDSEETNNKDLTSPSMKYLKWEALKTKPVAGNPTTSKILKKNVYSNMVVDGVSERSNVLYDPLRSSRKQDKDFNLIKSTDTNENDIYNFNLLNKAGSIIKTGEDNINNELSKLSLVNKTENIVDGVGTNKVLINMMKSIIASNSTLLSSLDSFNINNINIEGVIKEIIVKSLVPTMEACFNEMRIQMQHEIKRMFESTETTVVRECSVQKLIESGKIDHAISEFIKAEFLDSISSLTYFTQCRFENIDSNLLVKFANKVYNISKKTPVEIHLQVIGAAFQEIDVFSLSAENQQILSSLSKSLAGAFDTEKHKDLKICLKMINHCLSRKPRGGNK